MAAEMPIRLFEMDVDLAEEGETIPAQKFAVDVTTEPLTQYIACPLRDKIPFLTDLPNMMEMNVKRKKLAGA